MRRDIEVQFDGYHLRVLRRDDTSPPLSWDELQAIKDEYAGPEATAVEVYPPANEVVNECAMRHLWIVPPAKAPSLLRRHEEPEWPRNARSVGW